MNHNNPPSTTPKEDQEATADRVLHRLFSSGMKRSLASIFVEDDDKEKIQNHEALCSVTVCPETRKRKQAKQESGVKVEEEQAVIRATTLQPADRGHQKHQQPETTNFAEAEVNGVDNSSSVVQSGHDHHHQQQIRHVITPYSSFLDDASAGLAMTQSRTSSTTSFASSSTSNVSVGASPADDDHRALSTVETAPVSTTARAAGQSSPAAKTVVVFNNGTAMKNGTKNCGSSNSLDGIDPQLVQKLKLRNQISISQQHPVAVKPTTITTATTASKEQIMTATPKIVKPPSKNVGAFSYFFLQRNKVLVRLLFLVGLCLVRRFSVTTMDAPSSPPPPNSVYVSGGGFSGMWFILGRLRAMPRLELPQKEYYCYSAGCLATVATLAQWEMKELYNVARAIQVQWMQGDVSRYDVVSLFVNDLLYSKDHHYFDPAFLEKLHIITSVPGDSFGLAASIRTPTSMPELFEMLVQTTWIPGVTGGGLWHDQGHMDGAFTSAGQQHPKCAHTIGFSPFKDDWRLFSNMVNVNLSQQEAELFWDMGLEYGF